MCFMVLGLMGWRLGCDWNIVQQGGGGGDGYDSSRVLQKRCRLDSWVGRKTGTFESKTEPPWSRSLVGTCGGSDGSLPMA